MKYEEEDVGKITSNTSIIDILYKTKTVRKPRLHVQEKLVHVKVGAGINHFFKFLLNMTSEWIQRILSYKNCNLLSYEVSGY